MKIEDSKIAHLGFIQNIITRMGANSFLLKGWSVTLVAALFALAVKDADKKFMLLAYFPVIVFWILDAYFFHQEILFRKLYEEVAEGRIKSEVFTLDTSSVMDKVPSMLNVKSARILCYFHTAILFVVLFAMLALVP